MEAENLQLYFGPNDRKIGRQFEGDPNVDEKTLPLAGFSVLPWLQRFPDWRLGVKLIPAMPPAPGVAIKKAAALAEGKDPDKAVQEARAKVCPLEQHPSPTSLLRPHPSPCVPHGNLFTCLSATQRE